MSGFDLKTPLREAIVTGLFYDSAQKQIFQQKWKLMKEKIMNGRKSLLSSQKPKEQMKIPGNRKCHTRSSIR